MSRSRREFVKLASRVAAGSGAALLLPRRVIAGLDPRLPIRNALGMEAPLRVDPAALTAIALDAARLAGASFASVVVDRQIEQSLRVVNTQGGAVRYSTISGVGIRVVADGQAGYAMSGSLEPDVVASAARRAVHQAQVNAKWRTSPVELVPTSAVPNGVWSTGRAVDPFEIPIGEQQEALAAGTHAALAVRGVTSAVIDLQFLHVDRVFASTDGSYITQAFDLTFPQASVMATALGAAETAGGGPEGFGTAIGGYERVRDAALPDKMRAAAAQALLRSKALIGVAAPVSVDVGRYEMVVGPQMLWGLIAGTIVDALGMELALGREEGGRGTTYATPPDAMLGQLHLGAPFLTVRGDRSTPGGLMTCGWDDEGVAPEDFSILEQGVVVDYLALRETAPFLGAWYRRRGAPVRSHGIAATSGWWEPSETIPNIAVEPGAEHVTTEDLIKDVKHGIYFSGGGGAQGDFGMLNAYGTAGGAQEIRNGKLGRHLTDVAIQFQTQAFWKGLLGIGGSSSVTSFVEGQPGLFTNRTVRSVPARFREVNIVNTGRSR